MPPQTPTPTPAAPKLSADQFAAQIKAKYPAYASVDNATLSQKMLAKYPQYADRVDLSPPAPAPQQPGFFSGLQQDFAKRAQNVVNGVQASGQDYAASPSDALGDLVEKPAILLRGLGRAAGQVVGGVGDIIGRGISAVLPKAVKDTAAGAVQAAAQSPVGQKVLKTGQAAYNSIPEAIRPDVGNLAGTLALAAGGRAATGAGSAIEGAATKMLPKAAIAVDRAVGAGRDARQADAALKSAVKAVTPDINAVSKTARGKLIGETVNGAPRVNEGGIFKGRTITPNASEQAAAKELASLPQYRPSGTALQNFNAVRNVIGGKAATFEKSLTAEQTIVPKKEIVSAVRSAITSKSDESLLLQGSDPAVNQYLRVVANAATKANGTPKGIWDVRKTMDAAYENARGKLAYDSDKVAALDEVHRAGRTALNDLMTKYAKNTNVKAQFLSLKNLYNAKDELLVKAQGEKGSILKRAAAGVRKHPIGAVAGAVGIEELLRRLGI
jgi:hypothetical protein